VSGEVSSVAIPAAVRLRLRHETRALPVEREHAIGLELQQVLRVQLLRALQRTAGQAHGRQGQRARDVRHRVDDPFGGPAFAHGLRRGRREMGDERGRERQNLQRAIHSNS
jgi:hypothetical protein